MAFIKKGSNGNVHRLTTIAILSALIIVLQFLASFVKFGPFSITLALVPILVGAAMYGPGVGAFLGFVFSLVVLIAGVTGIDGGSTIVLLQLKPVACVFMIFTKGILSAWLAGLTYQAIAKKSPLAGSVVSGIVCPVVNTGIFIVLMYVFFEPVLVEWFGSSAVMAVVLGLVTGNFILELTLNMVLASAISRVIMILSK